MDFEPVYKRVKALRDTVTIMEAVVGSDGGAEFVDVANENKLSMEKLKNNIVKSRMLLKQQHDLIEVTAEKIERLKLLEDKMNYMINNLPENDKQTKNKEAATSKGERAPFNFAIQDRESVDPARGCIYQENRGDSYNGAVSPVPESWMQQLSTPVTSHDNESLGSTAVIGTTALKKVQNQTVKYITEAQMANVPKYMKGRMNAITINNFIDSFNAALEKKYELLKQPRRVVKKKDLDSWIEWKQDQNLQPIGSHFVTGKDIGLYGNWKMDKTALNIITILRHLKLVHESRPCVGTIHYVVNN